MNVPIEGTDQGFEIVRFVQKEGKLFALMLVPVEDLNRIRVLKTDKKLREYQRVAQKKYRRKKFKKKENTT